MVAAVLFHRKVGIISSRATSLREVARDIAYVAKANRWTPIMLDYTANVHDLKQMFNRAIIVMCANPLFMTPWALLARDLLKAKVKTIFYATIEGDMLKHFVKPWFKRDVVYVANSEYTRRKLEQEGFKVIDVVPHGVVFEYVERGAKLVDALRQAIREKLGDGIYFVTVSSSHPRKGLDTYAMVVAKVRRQCKECKFIILTDDNGVGYFRHIDGVLALSQFGKRGRVEVFALYQLAHFLVHPSFSEGFGLPVLEAMACGTPAIHVAYEPLTEFSKPSFNIMIDYVDVKYESFKEGLNYELHIYDVNDMVSAILDAADMVKRRKSEYEDRKAKAREAAKAYDALKLYKRLLDLVK